MLADFRQEVSLLNTKITSSQHLLILLPEDLNPDIAAAGISLYLSLRKIGKQVTIACPTKLTVEFSDLIGVDEVKNEIGGKNFVISLNYKEGAIEKVSYNIENDRFNLVIKPREGVNWDIDEKNIAFHKQGVVADLIITIKSANLEKLGKFYKDEQKIYSETEIINIDNDVNNEKYGTINLVSPLSLSISELICLLMQDLGLPFDNESATNLLTGIDIASNHLQSEQVKSDTLEAAALCLKNNGVRVLGQKTSPTAQNKAALNKALKIEKTLSNNGDNIPSPDWLAPKIYKGSTLL
ncbi:MAG: hypothetical protein ACD_37C00498G0002 [uncultured bacterium]|nr:MAG: hypothetical protein ACD_37C00498G0002 [uncultured bacterium]